VSFQVSINATGTLGPIDISMAWMLTSGRSILNYWIVLAKNDICFI